MSHDKRMCVFGTLISMALCSITWSQMFGFDESPEDKVLAKKAEALGSRLFARAEALKWKSLGKARWSSNIYSMNYENTDGTQMYIMVRALDSFSAFELCTERIKDYRSKRAGIERTQDLGQVKLVEKPMYGHKDGPLARTYTYSTFEGYDAKAGTGYIMGTAKFEDAPPFPELGHTEPQQSTFHQFWLCASVDNLVVEGWYYTRQRLATPEDVLGERDWDDNLIVNAGQIARISESKVPGITDLRALINIALGQDATRNDNQLSARPFKAFITTPNVVVFGQGTDEMRAYTKTLQKTYDAFNDPATFPSAEQTKILFENFLTNTKRFDKAVGTAQTQLGNSDAVQATLIQVPGYQIKAQLALCRSLFDHWHNHGQLATERATATNEVLLANQNVLSLNVLKALFKNYLDWTNAIPSASPESLLGLFGGVAEQVPWDMPRSLSGWLETAEQDASILQKQAVTIKNLQALREFYNTRAEQAVLEMKALKQAEEMLKALETLHDQLSNDLYQLSHIKRQ